MLLSYYVSRILDDTLTFPSRRLPEKSLQVDTDFLTSLVKLRDISEKDVLEYGAPVLCRSGHENPLYLGPTIQGGKKDVYWPETLNSDTSYIGTFHTHPYQKRYKREDVGIGFSNGDLGFYGQAHVRPNKHPVCLHFLFSGIYLYLIVYWKDTSDTTGLARGEGDDITACRDYVKAVNHTAKDSNPTGTLIAQKVAAHGKQLGKGDLFYGMQMFIDDCNPQDSIQLESELIRFHYPQYPYVHEEKNIEMNSILAAKYNYYFYVGTCGDHPLYSYLKYKG